MCHINFSGSAVLKFVHSEVLIFLYTFLLTYLFIYQNVKIISQNLRTSEPVFYFVF